MPRKRQTTVGKVNPIDVRSKTDVGAFESLLGKGPLTIVLIYADWCGHCQTFKQNMWNEVSAMPNKKVNTASVHYDMVENTSLKNAKIEGYPSLLLVGIDKSPAEFKENGTTTNAMPTPESVTALKNMVNTPVNKPVSNANTVANTVLENASSNVKSVNTNSNTNENQNNVSSLINNNTNTNTNSNSNSMNNNANSYVPANAETLQVPDTNSDISKTAPVLSRLETGHQKGGQRGGTTSLLHTLVKITAEAGHAGALLLAATEYADVAKKVTRKLKKRAKRRSKTTKRR